MTILHRITWVDPAWRDLDAHDPFHPLHVPLDRQGHGRFDNPHRYAALYAATTDRAAVGETFGNLSRWTAATTDRLPRELDLPPDAPAARPSDVPTNR